MEEKWYLLWDPLNKWNVYNKFSVPDPGAFPEYMYKEYIIKEEGIKFMRKLMVERDKLNKKEIWPTPENYEEIFPILEEVLKNGT